MKYTTYPILRSILIITLFTTVLSSIQISGEGHSSPEFRWPIVRGELPDLVGITSTFGESRMDHFHSGLDIAGEGLTVHPVAKGKILFHKKKEDDPYSPSPGPGNYLLLEHESGYQSGYFHLKSVSVKQGMVDFDDEIGITGNTGHSIGAHLHFFIVENYGMVYLNPLKELPSITDNYAPTIGQLVILTGDSKTFISHSREENIRLTKRYPVYVIIIDPGMEKFTRRGPYKIKWRLNNGPEEKMVFDNLTFTGFDWLLDRDSSFDDVFYENYYNLGMLDFRDGDNSLILSAEDFAGNGSEVEYTIHVKREY